jgi:hypothetical protein
MESLSSKTVKELKEYAKENNINLNGATTKAKIVAAISDASPSSDESYENIVKATEPIKRVPVSSSTTNEDGVVSSRAAETFKVSTQENKKEESSSKVALHSEKNLHWSGVGAIKKGYNIVNKEVAKLWLTRRGTRKATPEEVATHYGQN